MDKTELNRIFEIMSSAFEHQFYRPFSEQERLISQGRYAVDTYRQDNIICGFISYWSFENFTYIEHIAVDENFRGKGIGGKLLDTVKRKYKNIVLEVEPPDTEIDKKRIEFYVRHGLYFNNYYYVQPPYYKGDNAEKLFIMSSKPLCYEEFIQTASVIYKNVYNADISDFGIYQH